jgi:translation initiation factor 4E
VVLFAFLCLTKGKKKAGPGHHRLETDWTIWFDKKSKTKDVPFEDLLVEVGRFQTIEQFWEYFRWLKPVTTLARDSSYHIFRRGAKPMWENFIHGGDWICLFLVFEIIA